MPKQVPAELRLKICMGCFAPRGSGACCSLCGYDFKEIEGNGELVPGIIVQDRYIIGKKAGAGSFGITYRAFDSKLQVKTALKEYFPADTARRHTDGISVITAPEHAGSFKKGLKTFLEEARMAARFTHPGIVSVKDFFEANNTAYLLMPFVEGDNLYAYVQEHGGSLDFTELRPLFSPLCEALSTLHAEGFIHRDISPDNVFITKEKGIKLLDFGSARRLGEPVHEKTGKHGFSPVEQYTAKVPEGVYTDIYALAATIFFASTGHCLPASPERLKNGTLPSLPSLLPKKSKKALLQALSLDFRSRQESMQCFKEQFFNEKTVGTFPKPLITALLLTVIALVLLLFALVVFYFFRDRLSSLV